MPKKVNFRFVNIADLTPDDHNANLGTPRGMDLLERSIQMNGNGRPGLIDKNGKIIAGNKFHAKTGELGFEEVLIVETDGTIPIFHQRTNLDLDTDIRARMMAWEDNAASILNVDWDKEVLQEDLDDGLPLDEIWYENELEEMLGKDEVNDDEIDQPGDPIYKITILCSTFIDMEQLFIRFQEEGLNVAMSAK